MSRNWVEFVVTHKGRDQKILEVSAFRAAEQFARANQLADACRVEVKGAGEFHITKIGAMGYCAMVV